MLWNPFFKSSRSKSNQSGLGGLGEDCAAKFLQDKGYKILQRNWYNKKGRRLGEIDIIALEEDVIVFVEVKSRSVRSHHQSASVLPQENITSRKLLKLSRIAEVYIGQKDLWGSSWRIDGLSVIFADNAEPRVQHFKGIFL